MRRVVFAYASAMAMMIATGGMASAADLPGRYPPPVYKAPPTYMAPYNWTGFYLGINGGGGFGTSRWDTTGSFDVSGGVVGGTIGYNWQSGPFVFGLEGDLDWSNISGTTNVLCAFGCRTSNSWLATVRGRLGYSFDRFMPYLTGGLALGDISARTPFFLGNSDTNTGWTVGAGVEVAITGNWSAKAEYLYVDLGHIACGLACGAAVVDDVSFNTHLVRGGLNYRF